MGKQHIEIERKFYLSHGGKELFFIGYRGGVSLFRDKKAEMVVVVDENYDVLFTIHSAVGIETGAAYMLAKQV